MYIVKIFRGNGQPVDCYSFALECMAKWYAREMARMGYVARVKLVTR